MKLFSLHFFLFFLILQLACSSHLKNTSLPFKLLPVNNDLFDSPPYQPEDDLKSLEMELNKDKYRRLVSSIPKGNSKSIRKHSMPLNSIFINRRSQFC